MDNFDTKKLKYSVIPKGFKVSGIHCGIKKTKKKDLGLIYSTLPSIACGMFTSNKTQSASLKICKEHLKNREVRAVIVNSGNANCFVGKRGFDDAINITKILARHLDIPNKSILMASTGIIGRPLPFEKIKAAIPKLCKELDKCKLVDFAESILTTDTFKKNISLRLKIKNKTVLITGIAKGAGMIYPHLEMNSKRQATMLAFILTDVAIKKSLLGSSLIYSTKGSFNSINIDGCTSTNDTVLLLANGAALNSPIIKKDKEFELFKEGLFYVCKVLAKMIIGDAEGATKQIEIMVNGAKSKKEAQLAADAVANSNLFKAAMFGGNPNWGRIVAAIGAIGLSLDDNKLEISFNTQKIFKKGRVYPLRFKNLLRQSKDIFVDINLNRGSFGHHIYTCDLTPEYVKINAEYN